MRIKDDIKDKFFKNAEIKYHLYKDISDFSIGEPITAAEIQNQEEAYENISIKRNLPEVRELSLIHIQMCIRDRYRDIFDMMKKLKLE